MTEKRPIGVFDSGIGGLTVVKQLRLLLPNENIVYFGDTARVPYGPKSPETIKRYAIEDTKVLLSYDPKLIIVACNTVSALALDEVNTAAPNVKIMGVVEAGATAAVQSSKTGSIGVIGTLATISSAAYSSMIIKKAPEASVAELACPLFVPLAEEGFTHHPATRLIAETYLSSIKNKPIDTLVLGCTHYPILREVIQEIMGKNVTIVDSAEVIAKEAMLYLTKEKMLANKTQGSLKVIFSDKPRSFKVVAKWFVDADLEEPIIINI